MSDSSYEASKELARINAGFYRAIEGFDLEAMRRIWEPSETVRCVHPGWESLRGFQSVLSSWEAIFGNTETITFEILDLAIEILGPLGWVTNVERIRSRSEGQAVASDAVATNLYRRSEGRWRMILHHASPIVRRFRGP